MSPVINLPLTYVLRSRGVTGFSFPVGKLCYYFSLKVKQGAKAISVAGDCSLVPSSCARWLSASWNPSPIGSEAAFGLWGHLYSHVYTSARIYIYHHYF